MIIENSKGLFGSRLAIIKDYNENYFTISTAKESLSKGLSTMIIEGKYPSIRPCGKIIYSQSLGKKDRQGLHDVIVSGIEAALNEDKLNLQDAIDLVCGDLKTRGAIVELINTAEGEKEPKATLELINVISTNPIHAVKAHEEELQKFFDKSPKEGTDKFVAVYFEYLYLNLNIFDRCVFDTLGAERRSKFMDVLSIQIAKSAAEKYFEGDYEEIAKKILFNSNKAQEEYSGCEELNVPLERAFSEKAMSTILSKRINSILGKGKLSLLNTISNLNGISFMHSQQPESDLAELITKSAKELGI